MSGEPHTGKTHMSVAVIQDIFGESNTVRFIDHTEFCNKVFNDDYSEYVRECEDCSVLIIDGLGNGSDSNDSTAKLMQLIRRRQKPTIYNVDIKATELIVKLGRDNVDVLMTACDVIKF